MKRFKGVKGLGTQVQGLKKLGKTKGPTSKDVPPKTSPRRHGLSAYRNRRESSGFVAAGFIPMLNGTAGLDHSAEHIPSIPPATPPAALGHHHHHHRPSKSTIRCSGGATLSPPSSPRGGGGGDASPGDGPATPHAADNTTSPHPPPPAYQRAASLGVLSLVEDDDITAAEAELAGDSILADFLSKQSASRASTAVPTVSVSPPPSPTPSSSSSSSSSISPSPRAPQPSSPPPPASSSSSLSRSAKRVGASQLFGVTRSSITIHGSSASRIEGFFPPTYTFDVQILLPNGMTILLLQVSASFSLEDVRHRLVKHESASFLKRMRMDRLAFRTPETREGFLPDEASTTLGSLPYVQESLCGGLVPQMILVERRKPLSKKERILQVEIGHLIGRPLVWTNQKEEIEAARKSLCSFIRATALGCGGTRHGGPATSHLEPRMCRERYRNPLPVPFLVRVTLPIREVEKTHSIDPEQTADDLAHTLFAKYYSKGPAVSRVQGLDHGDFTLKIKGLAEYVYGPHPLIQFQSIRDALEASERPSLVLVQKSVLRPKTRHQDGPAARSDGEDASSMAAHEQHRHHQDEQDEAQDEQDEAQDEQDEAQDEQDVALDWHNIRYCHGELEAQPWDRKTHISAWSISRRFKLRVLGLEYFSALWEHSSLKRKKGLGWESACGGLQVHVGLYHGGVLLCASKDTRLTACAENPRWMETVEFDIALQNIPRAARVCFTVRGDVGSDAKYRNPLGWVNFQLYDYKHELRTGLVELSLWPDAEANPIGTCVSNMATNTCRLYIEFEEYTCPLVFPTEPLELGEGTLLDSQRRDSLDPAGHMAEAKAAIGRDSLHILTPRERQVVWGLRHYLVGDAKALPKVLLSAPLDKLFCVQEMLAFLNNWAPITDPVDALELLDSKFAYAEVRAYAVKVLEDLSEQHFLDYLLQLTQVLKYEPYHDSALARFLLKRALGNARAGHAFYWYLRSEMHVEEIAERYGVLLEAYLRGCGPKKEMLKHQDRLISSLNYTANKIKPLKDDSRLNVMKRQLRLLSLPANLQLPLDPSMEVCGLRIDRCKYKDSKKLPLWLVWENSDGAAGPIKTIFKSGDDLRQDMLTLQMLGIMDRLWKAEGLNCRLSLYKCVCTGFDQGFIEVVGQSETTANISYDKGGGVAAAFKEAPLLRWIMQYNRGDEQLAGAVENFIYSCAGYCVATYVLGIGDRHNDNIMVTRDGRLFHIDFGHFLGNYKSKFGYRRERAPFVLTPDFAYVMGGKDGAPFAKFVQVCGNAYNILRRHHRVFLTLFAMMLSTGIPELRQASDLVYLRDAFALDKSDEEAENFFKDLIYESLATKTTQLMNAIHLIFHQARG